MRRGTWFAMLAIGAVMLVVSACGGGTREIEVGDVVRLNCGEHPEWGRMIEENNEGTYVIPLMTGPDVNAGRGGTVPCGHTAKVIYIDHEEGRSDDIRIQAVVDGAIVHGWLWGYTLEEVELERVEE